MASSIFIKVNDSDIITPATERCHCHHEKNRRPDTFDHGDTYRTCLRLNISSNGFTLMEVLVAVMLLAISLTLIIQNFSMGLKNISLSQSYTAATCHARNIMDETLLNPSIKPGIDAGVIDDHYKWERTISEIPHEPISTGSNAKEMEIRVKILWNYGIIPKDFELAALRIVKN